VSFQKAGLGDWFRGVAELCVPIKAKRQLQSVVIRLHNVQVEEKQTVIASKCIFLSGVVVVFKIQSG